MPVLFKRNSISSIGGAGTTEPHFGRQFGNKRPQEPSENDRILASKSHTQGVTLVEKKRQQDFRSKVEAARKVQRAWRRYCKNKSSRHRQQMWEDCTKDTVHKKRLRATQEEWERQIAALTIQLAWRKFFRRKLLRALHPNRRQLLMWDPEIIALKQEALVNFIYNEQIQAPFWHPTLKAPVRPLWFRFVPSAAAVSYNFAVDQYVPWVSRLGAQPPYPESESTLSSDISRPTTRGSGQSKGSIAKIEIKEMNGSRKSAASTRQRPTNRSASLKKKS